MKNNILRKNAKIKNQKAKLTRSLNFISKKDGLHCYFARWGFSPSQPSTL